MKLKCPVCFNELTRSGRVTIHYKYYDEIYWCFDSYCLLGDGSDYKAEDRGIECDDPSWAMDIDTGMPLVVSNLKWLQWILYEDKEIQIKD